jgi:hypothetical protein
MNRLLAILRNWGRSLAIFVVFVVLGWSYWTNFGHADSSQSQVGPSTINWLIFIIIIVVLIAWFIYAFTSIFLGKDWEERTKVDGIPRGVVWERRTLMVSFSYVFTVIFLLFPLWGRALIDIQGVEKDKEPMALLVGCAEPSFEDPDATSKKDDPKSVPKEVRCGANTDQWVLTLGFSSGFASQSILMMIRGIVEGIKPQRRNATTSQRNCKWSSDRQGNQPARSKCSVISHRTTGTGNGIG